VDLSQNVLLILLASTNILFLELFQRLLLPTLLHYFVLKLYKFSFIQLLIVLDTFDSILGPQIQLNVLDSIVLAIIEIPVLDFGTIDIAIFGQNNGLVLETAHIAQLVHIMVDNTLTDHDIILISHLYIFIFMFL